MSSPLRKASKQSIFQGTKGLWTQNESMLQPGIISQLQNKQSIIERLMQTREKPELGSILETGQFRNRQLLADTEERIFKEVMKLLDQVEDTKKQIIQVWEENRKMQVEHPEAIEMAHFHGYAQKLTLQQCTDLEEENLELAKKIAELQCSKLPDLKQVLKVQRERYQELKQGLQQGLQHSKPIAKQQKITQSDVNQLKSLIVDHQQKRRETLRIQYPEIDRIKQDNQELRLKTIENLKMQLFQQQLAQQLQAMKQFLRNEDLNREKFMEELTVFKQEFRRIKNQNQILKEKIVNKEKIRSKQNIKQNVVYDDRSIGKTRTVERPASNAKLTERPYSNARVTQRPYSRPRFTEGSSNKTQIQQTYTAKKSYGSSKLNEYESLLQHMQSRYF